MLILLNSSSQYHHQRLSGPGRSNGPNQKSVKTVIVPLAKTRLGLDINRDGGHKTKNKGGNPKKKIVSTK